MLHLSIFILSFTLLTTPVTPNRRVINGTVTGTTTGGTRSTFRFPNSEKPRVINQYYENGVNGNGIVHYQPYRPTNGVQPGTGAGHQAPGGVIGTCICPCTKEYLPLCGSDSKTYGNNCLFQCQRKCTPNLQFKSCGRCEEPMEDLKFPCF